MALCGRNSDVHKHSERAAGYAEYVEKKYAPLPPPNIPLISVVNKGEIYSLAKFVA